MQFPAPQKRNSKTQNQKLDAGASRLIRAVGTPSAMIRINCKSTTYAAGSVLLRRRFVLNYQATTSSADSATFRRSVLTTNQQRVRRSLRLAAGFSKSAALTGTAKRDPSSLRCAALRCAAPATSVWKQIPRRANCWPSVGMKPKPNSKKKKQIHKQNTSANRRSLRLAASCSKCAAFSGNSEERSFVAALPPLNAFGSRSLVAARKALAALSG